MRDERKVLRTYSHLGDGSTAPSEYEIVTSRLLYYVDRGFEVDVPFSRWVERYQRKSPFRSRDFEAYLDPRRTTYTSYTRLQRDRELELDRAFEASERDAEHLSEAWLERLSGVLGPLRYPIHGLQMIACYVGQLAPAGRIAMSALFQASDELRRIDRLAYRTRQLQLLRPSFAADARERWQTEAAYQPLRELIERLLVRYDFGEALIGLNLCIKPLFDAVTTRGLSDLGQAHDDPLLALMVGSFADDSAWHEAWTWTLVQGVLAEGEVSVREAVQSWSETWRPLSVRALAPIALLLDLPLQTFHEIESTHAARLRVLIEQEEPS